MKRFELIMGHSSLDHGWDAWRVLDPAEQLLYMRTQLIAVRRRDEPRFIEASSSGSDDNDAVAQATRVGEFARGALDKRLLKLVEHAES